MQQTYKWHALVYLGILSGLFLLVPDNDKITVELQAFGAEQFAWHQIITGPLMHINATHWALNIIAFGLIDYLFAGKYKLRTRLFVLLISIFLSSTALLLIGFVGAYVGLSATIYSYLLAVLFRTRNLTSLAIGLLVIGKVAAEALELLPTSAALIQAPVLVESHFAGIGAGVLIGLAWLWCRQTENAQ